MGRLHGGKDLMYEVIPHILVKQIAHAVYEDELGFLPLKWLFQALRPYRQVKAHFVGMSWDATEALCEGLCVAICAARRNLCAPRHGVPGGLGPFDVTV